MKYRPGRDRPCEAVVEGPRDVLRQEEIRSQMISPPPVIDIVGNNDPQAYPRGLSSLVIRE